ncbi:MAG: hypothetical protein IKO55_08145, partial [Kiritimatiellae bacterium]|nr:hypothetical protein [Kiritimatiellia bacterium]
MARQSDITRRKKPTATSLSSDELSLIDREIKERSLFSARTTEQRSLESTRDVLEDFTSGG